MQFVNTKPVKSVPHQRRQIEEERLAHENERNPLVIENLLSIVSGSRHLLVPWVVIGVTHPAVSVRDGGGEEVKLTTMFRSALDITIFVGANSSAVQDNVNEVLLFREKNSLNRINGKLYKNKYISE